MCVDAPTVNTGAIELEWPHWAEIQLPCGHAGARGTEDPRPHFFSRETVHNRVGKKLSCRSLFCIFLMRKWHWIVSWRPKDQSGIGHASLCWFSSVTGLSRLRFIVTSWYSYFFMVVLLIVTPKSIPLTSSHGLPPAEHFKTLAWRQACKSVQQVVQGIYLRKGGKTCRRHVFLLWSLTSLTQK